MATQAQKKKAKPEKPAPFVPIYKQLVDRYKNDILTLKLAPGSRIASINEIIEQHSVSRETAKLVLKLLAQQGFIIKKPGKGSFVTDIRPCKKLWGVVLPFYSIQYEYLLEQLSEKAWKMGRGFHHFVDYNSSDEEIRLVGQLINERYEAVIVIPTQNEAGTSEFYERLRPQKTFVTLIDHSMSGSYFPYVIQSYDLGVQRALRYLAGKTNAHIAFVRNQVWADRNVVQEMMEQTYTRFIETEAESSKPIIIERLNRIDAGFLKSENIGGIFCCDDSDAVRIAGRLRTTGVAIPGQVSLVSYGNTDLSRYFTPAITSIDPHSEEMADIMAHIMKKKFSGDETDYCQYVVQPTLVERET